MASRPQQACPSVPHPTTSQATTLVPDILLATNLLAYLLADGGNQPSPSSDLSAASLLYPPARYASLNKLAHESTVVRRPITSTTYARRMFITEPLAILFGFDWPSVQACRLAETKLPAFVVDDFGRKWGALFEPRGERTITGQLGGGWSAFASAHGLRVGDVVEFWRQPGEWAGEYGVRARVVKGGWPEVHGFEHCVERCNMAAQSGWLFNPLHTGQHGPHGVQLVGAAAVVHRKPAPDSGVAVQATQFEAEQGAAKQVGAATGGDGDRNARTMGGGEGERGRCQQLGGVGTGGAGRRH